jgi:hypothetical protein
MAETRNIYKIFGGKNHLENNCLENREAERRRILDI